MAAIFRDEYLMHGIHVIHDGKKVPAHIEKMFGEFGPYMLNGKRLDLLTKVQILVDSSISTTTTSGSSSSSASTGNMVKRAIVGGVLLGGAGALVGGVTGKRDSEIKSTSTESITTELTAELSFADGRSQYVFLTNMEGFHWLLGQANLEPMSDAELNNAEINEKNRILRIALHEEVVKNTKVPVLNKTLAEEFGKKYYAPGVIFTFFALWLFMSSFWGALFLAAVIGFFVNKFGKEIHSGYLTEKRGSDAANMKKYHDEIALEVQRRYGRMAHQVGETN